MKKIIVIGCPGSGKSTFSAALHSKIGIPLYHLDIMYWNADRTKVERDLFLKRLDQALAMDKWIIDGNYASTMELRIAACDTVFFLDYPTEVCLDGLRLRRGKARCDIPWIETEEDAAFTEYVKNYNGQNRPAVLELLDKYKDGRTVFIFQNRAEADNFIESL